MPVPRSIWALLLLPLLALAGCDSMGPGTVARDRFDYAGAVGESWKSQMLLNLVKIRYGDIPVFMDVGQVVAGYSMQRTVSGTASFNTFNQGAPFQAITGALGPTASVTYNDSPTITYTPLQGERFARSIMGSIPPQSCSAWPFNRSTASTTAAWRAACRASTCGRPIPNSTCCWSISGASRTRATSACGWARRATR